MGFRFQSGLFWKPSFETFVDLLWYSDAEPDRTPPAAKTNFLTFGKNHTIIHACLLMLIRGYVFDALVDHFMTCGVSLSTLATFFGHNCVSNWLPRLWNGFETALVHLQQHFSSFENVFLCNLM